MNNDNAAAAVAAEPIFCIGQAYPRKIVMILICIW